MAIPQDILELYLIRIWEDVLGIQPIGVKDNFFDLGGHSMLVVHLWAQIKKTLSKDLPLATFFQAPTVEQLANILRQQGSADPRCLIQMNGSESSRKPLFWGAVGLGDLNRLEKLAQHLGIEQPVYGLLCGWDKIQNPTTHIQTWATHYVDKIRAVQPEGPYLLGGYCMGGLVAFEIAQQLQAQGQKVALLTLVETYSRAPLYLRYRAMSDYAHFYLHSLLQYVVQAIDILPQRIKAWPVLEFITRDSAEDFVPVDDTDDERWTAARLAVRSYTPQQIYPSKAALFFSRRGRVSSLLFPRYGWGKLISGELELYVVPSDHSRILEEPRLQVLAQKLRTCIDKALAAQI